MRPQTVTSFWKIISKPRELLIERPDDRSVGRLPRLRSPVLVSPCGFAARRKRIAGDEEAEEVGFAWEKLDDGQVFDIDLTDMNIVLNREYRHEILDGASASAADAPLVKLLLFQLYKDDFARHRSSRKLREHINLTNALLFEVIKIRLKDRDD